MHIAILQYNVMLSSPVIILSWLHHNDSCNYCRIASRMSSYLVVTLPMETSVYSASYVDDTELHNSLFVYGSLHLASTPFLLDCRSAIPTLSIHLTTSASRVNPHISWIRSFGTRIKLRKKKFRHQPFLTVEVSPSLPPSSSSATILLQVWSRINIPQVTVAPEFSHLWTW